MDIQGVQQRERIEREVFASSSTRKRDRYVKTQQFDNRRQYDNYQQHYHEQDKQNYYHHEENIQHGDEYWV